MTMGGRNTAATAALAVLLAAQLVFSGQLVEFLPGYQGKLPVKLETGYVRVGDVETFYYFIESQGNPKTDPLILWFSGGPGCSALSGLFFEIGPLEFNLTAYENDGLVTLQYSPETWTKYASMIFVDTPVGTGFSYSTTADGWASSDTKAAHHVYQFLLKWLEENPKQLGLDVYVGADSYAGLIVPLVTMLIAKGLETNVQPYINLKGFVIGSPITDKFAVNNLFIVDAHSLALISDKLYTTLKESCSGNYVVVDPSNTECVLAMQQYNKCIKDVAIASVLEAQCLTAIGRRSLQDSSKQLSPSSPRTQRYPCLSDRYLPSYKWANDPQVRKALHVRKDSIGEWIRCNHSVSYIQDVESVVNVHKYLTTKDLSNLVMQGDRDFAVPYMATEQWIKTLNLTVGEEWRPWFVEGQVAGYTEKYVTTGQTYQLVYATVKGAGHVVQLFYRERSFHMFQRWINGYPL